MSSMELDMTRQALEELQNEYDAFVYAVSHDFGAPLRSIVGFSELINERYHEKLDTAGKKYLEFLFSGGRKSQLMLESLLTLSRLRVESEACEWLCLDQLIESVVGSLQLPGKTEPTILWRGLPSVWGSKVHLQRVFHELLNNALAYSEGRRRILIEIEAVEKDGHWQVSVRDNGVGIPEGRLAHIFDPFYQVQAKEGRAGMGLTYCRKAVREHGGSLWVESVPGQGSTFTFTLPCKAGELGGRPESSASNPLEFLEDRDEGILFLDRQSRIQFVNPAGAQLLAKKISELEGSLFTHPISEELSEIEIVRPNGKPGIATMQVQSSTWERGPALMVTLVDVSELKEQERRDQQSEKMEAVGRLAGGIAHDFNNVLAAIQSYTTLLRTADKQEREQLLSQVEQTLEQGRGLTNRLLTFSERSRPSFGSLDINEIVSNMQNLLQKTLGPRIELKCQLLPGEAPALADRSDVAQILLNLLSNARDAMPGGGTVLLETGSVEVECEENHWGLAVEPGRYLSLRVSDQGAGICEDILPKIFDPFFSTKKDALNSGLGLSIVYNTLRQHEGGLRIRSSGQGTTMDILLPWGSLASKPRLRAQLPTRDDPETTKLRILLVDDDRHVRDATTRLLSKLGHHVTAASSGREALEIAAKTGPLDLLMTDVAMPEMNGFQLWPKFRELRPQTQVVFVSGYSCSSLAGHQELDSGQFLTKPYNARDLKELLNQIAARQLHDSLPLTTRTRAIVKLPPKPSS